MTEPVTDRDGFSGPCQVCGETVGGVPYVSLGLFFVGGGVDIDGLFFKPDDALWAIDAWEEVHMTRAVHLACAQTYFDGVYADLQLRRKTEDQQ